MPVPHVTAERCPHEAMRTIRIMVEAYLERNQTFFAKFNTLHNFMLLPIPEVQMVTVFASSHIIQVEAFGKRIGRSPFAADHHIMPWLVPVVIVVVHALSFLLPTTCNVEILIEQQETTGTIALPVAQHRNHNVPIGKAVNGMGSGKIRLLLDLLRFDLLVQFWGPFIRDVQNVNAAGEIAWSDQKTPRFAFVSM